MKFEIGARVRLIDRPGSCGKLIAYRRSGAAFGAIVQFDNCAETVRLRFHELEAEPRAATGPPWAKYLKAEAA